MDFIGDYDYIYEEPSDDEDERLSSDDEGVYQDVATGRLTLRTKKPVPTEDSDEEEDFEHLMTRELNDRISRMEGTPGANKATASMEDKTSNDSNQKSDQYSDIYFDSDEETEPGGSGVKTDHKILSNDELLYDPESDNEDQKWIDKRRRRYLPPPKSNTNASQVKPLPQSDAVLNCPGCMTMLCLDCQRHDVYHSQFRAMFVFNCTVNSNESLNYPLKASKKRKSSKATEEKFNPVKCSVCGTEVAVYDKDEVYHFFNIIASHS